jgi:hypothetical protein
VARGKIVVGLLVVVLTAVAVVAPANAGKPKPGSWFSAAVDPDDEDNLSSIQFNLAKSGKALKKVTIYWRCRNLSGYHNFSNPPIPIGVNKKQFKLVGATTPPAGQPTKDFTLKGKFTSGKKATYSMQLEGCGPRTKGTLTHAES